MTKAPRTHLWDREQQGFLVTCCNMISSEQRRLIGTWDRKLFDCRRCDEMLRRP